LNGTERNNLKRFAQCPGTEINRLRAWLSLVFVFATASSKVRVIISPSLKFTSVPGTRLQAANSNSAGRLKLVFSANGKIGIMITELWTTKQRTAS
jgi:hypothetical protein